VQCKTYRWIIETYYDELSASKLFRELRLWKQ